MKKITSLFLVLFSLTFVGRRLEGRATSFDTLSFRPATDHGLYLGLHGADVLKPYEWTAGFHLDYARSPLTQLLSDGTRRPIVRDIVGGHLSASFGILEWFELGLNPNFALLEKFFDPVTGDGSTRARMGDTRFSAKFSLLPRTKSWVGVSFAPYIDLPTGSGASFVGNNSFAGGGTVALETRQFEDRLTFALNLGYYTRDRVSVSGTPFDDLVTFGFGGNFVIVKWLELIADFRGGTMVSGLATTGTPFEGGGGPRFFLDKDRRWQITTAVAAGVGKGLGNPSVRGIIGVAFTPPRPVRGVELQESAREAFEIYELKEVDELKELRQTCPAKEHFNPKRHDPRCVKVYLSQ